MSETPTLDPVQEHVLALIAAGSSITTAARTAGIHRNTVGYWLRSPDFANALAQAHYDQALRWREQAIALAPDALTTIQSILADPAAPAAARLKAAFTILDHATKPLPQPPEPLPVRLISQDDPEDDPDGDLEDDLEGDPEAAAETLHKNAQNGFVRSVPESPEPPTPIARGPKTGRNEPCPCGSGKKYKRCCLSQPQPASANPQSPAPTTHNP